MKLILSFLLFLFFTYSVSGEFTNGAFCLDKNAESTFISQNSTPGMNRLELGKTYQVKDGVLEIKTLESTTFYFSGGFVFQASADSEFSVLSFDQNIENISSIPKLAKFGSHILSFQFTKGEYALLYNNKGNENSTINISTAYSDFELQGGKYYFKLTGKSVLGYTLDGKMNVHGYKNKVKSVDLGEYALASPFRDNDSGVDDKFVLSIRKAKDTEAAKFSTLVLSVEPKLMDVEFFVIDGKVVGIWLK
jgi:hypothetical protein